MFKTMTEKPPDKEGEEDEDVERPLIIKITIVINNAHKQVKPDRELNKRRHRQPLPHCF